MITVKMPVADNVADYAPPTAEEKEYVKLFGLSDFDVDLAVGIHCEEKPVFETFGIMVAADHGIGFNEFQHVLFRQLVDDQLEFYLEGGVCDESRARLLRLADLIEAEASYLRQRVNAAPPEVCIAPKA